MLLGVRTAIKTVGFMAIPFMLYLVITNNTIKDNIFLFINI